MNKSLGKGLKALIKSQSTEIDNALEVGIDINLIFPNKLQPRKLFNEKGLEDLASSIKEKGVLQPITVRELTEEKFELIAGERRYRASKIVGLKKIPAYILDVKSDTDMLEMALIENIQREDLNPIEEAEGYLILVEKFNLTQELVARRVGKSRPVIANRLRLLKLPIEIRSSLRNGLLSKKHAELIAGLNTKGLMIAVFQKVIKDSLSIRKTKELIISLENIQKVFKNKKSNSSNFKNKNSQLEANLCSMLRTKVLIKNKSALGKGQIIIKII